MPAAMMLMMRRATKAQLSSVRNARKIWFYKKYIYLFISLVAPHVCLNPYVGKKIDFFKGITALDNDSLTEPIY